jgi:hypothetical protein
MVQNGALHDASTLPARARKLNNGALWIHHIDGATSVEPTVYEELTFSRGKDADSNFLVASKAGSLRQPESLFECKDTGSYLVTYMLADAFQIVLLECQGFVSLPAVFKYVR